MPLHVLYLSNTYILWCDHLYVFARQLPVLLLASDGDADHVAGSSRVYRRHGPRRHVDGTHRGYPGQPLPSSSARRLHLHPRHGGPRQRLRHRSNEHGASARFARHHRRRLRHVHAADEARRADDPCVRGRGMPGQGHGRQGRALAGQPGPVNVIGRVRQQRLQRVVVLVGHVRLTPPDGVTCRAEDNPSVTNHNR